MTTTTTAAAAAVIPQQASLQTESLPPTLPQMTSAPITSSSNITTSSPTIIHTHTMPITSTTTTATTSTIAAATATTTSHSGTIQVSAQTPTSTPISTNNNNNNNNNTYPQASSSSYSYTSHAATSSSSSYTSAGPGNTAPLRGPPLYHHHSSSSYHHNPYYSNYHPSPSITMPPIRQRISWAPDQEKELERYHTEQRKLCDEESKILTSSRKSRFELELANWETKKLDHQLELVQRQWEENNMEELVRDELASSKFSTSRSNSFGLTANATTKLPIL
ncbi:uncharacterized protein BX663DRAFT_512262 [Cokeromyces recurvatus]|uniref:uncharacterized protein n=1 Tax=Cokeromyces recurvatus TaxID=90255 RepID=UPI0022201DB5|nr:uncharacterized protein BX663DRAFT_512262 [Cokeromyces recurvatus]KAI7902249.1 hypothetical protein BX663DRAFT_512262 [Cokeromyces recurvatus]